MTVKHPSLELPMLIALNVPDFTPVEARRIVKARWGFEQAPQSLSAISPVKCMFGIKKVLAVSGSLYTTTYRTGS